MTGYGTGIAMLATVFMHRSTLRTCSTNKSLCAELDVVTYMFTVDTGCTDTSHLWRNGIFLTLERESCEGSHNPERSNYGVRVALRCSSCFRICDWKRKTTHYLCVWVHSWIIHKVIKMSQGDQMADPDFWASYILTLHTVLLTPWHPNIYWLYCPILSTT